MAVFPGWWVSELPRLLCSLSLSLELSGTLLCGALPHLTSPPLVLLTVPCPVLWETADTKLTPLPYLWLPSFEALTLLLVWNFKV